MKGSATIRGARLSDGDLLLRWRNDPFIVALGSLRRTVTPEEHVRWFADALASGDRALYIIESDGEPIGQMRFDRLGESAVISIYVLEAWTGKGLGVVALRAGCGAIFERWDIRRVVAHVRGDNRAGAAGFMKAGFAEGTGALGGPPAHRSFVLARDGT